MTDGCTQYDDLHGSIDEVIEKLDSIRHWLRTYSESHEVSGRDSRDTLGLMAGYAESLSQAMFKVQSSIGEERSVAADAIWTLLVVTGQVRNWLISNGRASALSRRDPDTQQLMLAYSVVAGQQADILKTILREYKDGQG
ncbi:MAG TPA: hypothetical protein VHS06_05115 [Chloroflexota bacterium]|nr:hypothetical protein [Chloroflexota bacterium]